MMHLCCDRKTIAFGVVLLVFSLVYISRSKRVPETRESFVYDALKGYQNPIGENETARTHFHHDPLPTLQDKYDLYNPEPNKDTGAFQINVPEGVENVPLNAPGRWETIEGPPGSTLVRDTLTNIYLPVDNREVDHLPYKRQRNLSALQSMQARDLETEKQLNIHRASKEAMFMSMRRSDLHH